MDLSFRFQWRPSDADAADADEHVDPIDLARQRLLDVEAAIERRYLKAPLGHR